MGVEIFFVMSVPHNGIHSLCMIWMRSFECPHVIFFYSMLSLTKQDFNGKERLRPAFGGVALNMSS